MRSLRYVTEGSAKICWATNNSGVQGSAATREGRPWLNPRSLPPTHGARSSPGRQHPCLHDRRSAGQLQQLPQQLLVALPLLAGVFLVGMLVDGKLHNHKVSILQWVPDQQASQVSMQERRKPARRRVGGSPMFAPARAKVQATRCGRALLCAFEARVATKRSPCTEARGTAAVVSAPAPHTTQGKHGRACPAPWHARLRPSALRRPQRCRCWWRPRPC